jgi:hypothetical protein
LNGDIAFVAEEFAEQVAGQLKHGFAVIDIGGGDLKSEEFCLVVNQH